MIRQVVLDTETTGLDPEEGHRIIEIGCVELLNRRRTDNNFHCYLNPDREIDDGAFSVHGISNEFLADKPRFVDVVRDLLDYIKGSELIIHNAEFDVGFIDHELNSIGDELGRIGDYAAVLDTLTLARQLHPGQRNDLDALCRRYEIDNSERDLHGALLDAEILAEVYLAMTGGQTALLLDAGEGDRDRANRRVITRKDRAPLPVIAANEDELAEHDRWLDQLDKSSGGPCLWRRLPD